MEIESFDCYETKLETRKKCLHETWYVPTILLTFLM